MIQDKSKSTKQRLSESAESERASARVTDVVAAFKKTAERRREQLNQNEAAVQVVRGFRACQVSRVL